MSRNSSPMRADITHLLTFLGFIVIIFAALVYYDQKTNIVSKIGSRLLSKFLGS